MDKLIYYPGAKVLCRVNEAQTLIFNVEFYDTRYASLPTREFEVAGWAANNCYAIVVPDGMENSYPMTPDLMFSLQLKLDNKYLNKNIYIIKESAIGGRKLEDPYANPIKCSICNEYFPYAETNQPDGTLICWVCNSTRKY